MNSEVVLSTAFLLGLAHAIEVDHMIAVTAFVSTRPALRNAAGFGLRWGLGHSIAVLVAGGILIATGLRWPVSCDALGEALVGALLVAVGVWVMRGARNLDFRASAHSSDGHDHHEYDHGKRGMTMVGLMHGLAGTSAVVALVPVTMMEPWAVGLAYLLAFGAGTIIAMTAYALLAALAFRRASAASSNWARAISRFAGLGSISVGAWWIWKAVG